MKNLVLKDKMGQIIRVFRCETQKVCLVYRQNKGRLDVCSSPDFFTKESVLVLDKWEIGRVGDKRPVPLIQGFLEVSDEVFNVPHSLPRLSFSPKDLWLVSGSVSSFFIALIGLLYGLSQWSSVEEKTMPEQQIVKIIKPPVLVRPKKVVIGNNRILTRDSKNSQKKKVLKKSLKKMGALSVLGSLSKKDSRQRGGLNLGSSKVSTGPGLRAVASNSASGGVQDSLYSKGMITSALGSGGNIRGGGGHGTKGTEAGGGSTGYGELTLIGSGGSEDLSSSTLLSTEGNKFDFNIINREIIKKIGKIRQCYDEALRTEPNLKGLFKIYFTIKPKGSVGFSKIHPSSPVRSPKISSCILSAINQIRFPIQLTSVAGIEYTFDLSALETEGGI